MKDFFMADMPKEFWQTLSEKENSSIFETGMLDRKLCRRLWAMLGRTDKPPHKLLVTVRESDLQRMLAQFSKH